MSSKQKLWLLGSMPQRQSPSGPEHGQALYVPHLAPKQPPAVEFVEVVDVEMVVVDVLENEEKLVVGVMVVLADLVVGIVEERMVDLTLEVEDFTVEGDDEDVTLVLVVPADAEGEVLGLLVGREGVGEVELPLGIDGLAADEREESEVLAVAAAVGTASAVNLSPVMPQQEQAEE